VEDVAAGDEADPLYPKFKEYDANGRGYLSKFEVKRMMTSASCHADLSIVRCPPEPRV
jgi:hypothetical protein